MAIMKHNALGIPHGKIGNLVFYRLNDKLICKRIGNPGPATPLQLVNRQKMTVTMKLLSPMLKYLDLGFAKAVKGTDKNAHNLATAYHKKHALKGEYPNIEVDYEQVIISQGTLAVIQGVQLSKAATGLHFTWDASQQTENGEYDDLVMIMVCYTDTQKADSHLNAAKRSDGVHFLQMRSDDLKKPMAIYMSLRSADGRRISDSSYLGALNVRPKAE
ncbi:hypothetical protein H9X96_14825 [Pedobacter sp. N36a]|uniref:DUF6266 family protein n=1 Tax=Pedobacter sp. N36a TaxID=2767996 RepID=UPI001656B1C1|nr:DUF6266 family protein [Pedobacter sp. N36a]MBC8987044.1 hypothetical protein [Pedobacter sp. N36a]